MAASSSGDGRGVSAGGSVAATCGHRAVPHQPLEPGGRAEHEHARRLAVDAEGVRDAHRHERGGAGLELEALVRGLHGEPALRARRSSRPAGGCAAAARRPAGRGTRSGRSGPSLASPGTVIVASVPTNQRRSPSPGAAQVTRRALLGHRVRSLLRGRTLPSITRSATRLGSCRSRYHSSAARQRSICSGSFSPRASWRAMQSSRGASTTTIRSR